MTKKKKIKKTSIPVVKRRLFRLVSQLCRERANFTCEVCGMKNGTIINGKKQKVEAHHIVSRDFKNSTMKWDLGNLICVCSVCHKFGKKSAHKNPVWFAEWLKTNKPEQYNYVLEHYDDEKNLDDRSILEDIETNLKKSCFWKYEE